MAATISALSDSEGKYELGEEDQEWVTRSAGSLGPLTDRGCVTICCTVREFHSPCSAVVPLRRTARSSVIATVRTPARQGPSAPGLAVTVIFPSAAHA